MPVEETPSGTFRARWREGGNPNPRSKTFRRKVDAERHLRSVLTDIDRGTYVPLVRSTATVAETADDWLAAARRLKPATRETYRRDLDRHVLPVLGHLRLGRLTPEVIDGYMDGRLAAGAAASSVSRERRTLSAMCSWAVRRGRLGMNPVDRTDAPRVDVGEMRFLDAGELDRLADAIRPHRRQRDGTETLVGPGRYRALVLVAGWGGLRWSELVGLRPGDVDGDVVQVRSQLLQARDRSWYRAEPKSAAGARRVTLPFSVAVDLAEHMDAFAVRSGPHGPLVFPTRAGGPVTYSSWHGSHWRPALERAGLGHLRPHDLRHTAVALAVAAGAHPKTVQVRMGHSSIKVTLDTYGHLFPDLEDSLAAGLEALRRPAASA